MWFSKAFHQFTIFGGDPPTSARISRFRSARWPLLDPHYHAAALATNRLVGYALLPVLLESVLFVGVGSFALRALLQGGGALPALDSRWLQLECVAALLLLWHLLHGLTRWGGRLRITPRALPRAFRGDHLLVSALTSAPIALATALSLAEPWLSAVSWGSITLAHLLCQLRWLANNRDLWAAQWEDTERRTAFGPRHSGRQKKFWREFFTSLRAEQPDARIVDIGSGNLDIPQIAQAASGDFELHATDISPVDVGSFSWATDLQFHRWPFEETEFPNDFLDALTSSNAIEYSKNIDGALREAFRILRPRARGAFLLHHPDSHVVEHFRRGKGDIETLRALGVEQAVERFLRTRGAEDHAKLEKSLAALRSSGRRDLVQQAQLISKLCRETAAIELWIEFKDTTQRNFILACDLCRMAESHLASEDILRSHFERAGFEIERFERFESGKGVVNWAVIARVP